MEVRLFCAPSFTRWYRLARVWPGRIVPAEVGVQVGVVSVPKSGEQVCGDSWGVQGHRAGAYALVADGLGHGPLASQAAEEARRLFMRGGSRAPGSAVQKIPPWCASAIASLLGFSRRRISAAYGSESSCGR